MTGSGPPAPGPVTGPTDTLELHAGGHRLLLGPGRRVVVGRGDGVDLDLPHPGVSRLHLVVEPDPAGWTVVDHSRNGTFLGQHRITRLTVTGPVRLHLGSVSDGAPLDLVPGAAAPPPAVDQQRTGQGQVTAVHDVRTARITVGRLPDNDVVLDDLLVSRQHAVLDRGPTGWTLTDLGTGNGTFVNGRRVTRAPITPGDVIGIGHGLLQFDGDRLVASVDRGGNVFAAEDLTVTTPQGKVLLQSVGFTLSGNSLLAVIGPSGAGKSTLLHALTGARPADSGHVRYADRDLYEDYDELRQRIGLVPQDDVLHTQLTVRQALTYAARLRFPADTTAADRRGRIAEVLEELGLTAHADQRITSLSGGQRKRTSVALELLTQPSLLFLDEPTSGLDPGMDRSVMRTLRALADDGRTVVVVTHNVANLELCDQLLVLAPGGHVAYAGPPANALRYFGRSDFADVFLLLETLPGEEWARRFRGSPDHRRAAASSPGHRTPGVEPAARPAPATGPRQQNPLTQFAVLVRRYLAVIASDRQYAVSLAILPLVLSALAHAVPGSSGLSVRAAARSGEAQPAQLLLVLVIGAVLMGAAASVRELVKERPVYLRERAIGLSIGAYLASKVVVLALVTGLQAVLFTVVALLGRPGPDDPLLLGSGRAEVLLAVLAVTWTAMLTGLAISAAIDNADRGMPLLVVLIMVQLILCGGLFPVDGRVVLEQLSWLVPSRWGYAMTAATADLNALDPGAGDPAWEHSTAIWASDASLLLATGVALVVATALLLARLDPRRRGPRP
ncbi:FHA domain-containing protein [Geodermatophilus sabuli]|uniref:FHA modulated ABC efflux pump with fused ATPase and integral membrane subunits n=1 Tax=Geodermatophilus sabuli TaxID=1564158 RepID=A0A285E771_9ACTN|nr:FHA domain-containing protein [Geodermatophilus sabuli]MBB3082149.1 ABC-type multidrug transport system ATPase subunit [Geodermatophilus sabuli]SNX94979.1 FHA modulated ABC efflux pump with fused ATPase and integral membrane subunits [Geodermatophilus sabuli]